MLDPRLIESEFAALKGALYFNSAYMGPFPARTQAALSESIRRWANPSKLDYSWLTQVEDVRARIAALLGVPAERCSIQSSCGEAISFFANGCRLREGDRVALFQEEYPSEVLPWLFARESRGGPETDFYPRSLLRDPEGLRRALHPRTRFLNLSHVGFQDGSRVDLVAIGRLLHEREIRFVVDTTQGLGAIALRPEELERVDLLVCSPYKWLLSPYGQAFACWSERALSEVRQTQGNWLTQPNSPNELTVYSTRAKPGALRFDRGQSPNILGMRGLSASLSLFLEIGLAEIERNNLGLAAHFLENVDRAKYEPVTGGELRSAIVCLKCSAVDPESLQRRLQDSNVDVSVREGNARFSFHLFNTREQVDRLLSLL